MQSGFLTRNRLMVCSMLLMPILLTAILWLFLNGWFQCISFLLSCISVLASFSLFIVPMFLYDDPNTEENVIRYYARRRYKRI